MAQGARRRWVWPAAVAASFLVGIGVGNTGSGTPAAAPQPRATVTEQVTDEVTEEVTETVTERVTVTPRARAVPPTAAAAEPEPEPAPSADPVLTAMSPELFSSLFDGIWADARVPAAGAFEAEISWIESVDKFEYQVVDRLVRMDATSVFGGSGFYDRRPSDLRAHTWEVMQWWSVNAWAATMRGIADGQGGYTFDWPALAPALAVVIHGGEATVTCPGTLLHAVSQRNASRTDFEVQCVFS